MRFQFTEEQKLFAGAVREALEKTCPPEAVRSGPRPGPGWAALADVGLFGAHVAEEYGGLGLTPVDTVLAYEETGWFAVPGPVVETGVVAPLVVPADRLADLAAGRLVVSARPAGDRFLPDADLADLVAAGGRVAPRGAVALTPHRSADPARPLFTDDLDAAGAPGLDHAAVATAAQLLGLGGRLLAEAVGYAGERRQFGTAVGAFQAVKHRLADVAVALEFAGPLVHRAAYSLAVGAPDAARDASAAKLAAGRAAHAAARAALQVHGAIGYTDELDLRLWLTRVFALRPAWGDDARHRARLAGALLDGVPRRLPEGP
ncbi:acyl-CoA dehydrogenase family protein [Actinomadura atramentaria]|uniref:acyl-CoA dehydrogenase family protein n=1 Tax=Actinomadura atramentaria TaxID=1990 RepID=UPI0003648994|nr:acyl-CoA dehydrogenase family protein [Actinomadura atramentaria]